MVRKIFEVFNIAFLIEMNKKIEHRMFHRRNQSLKLVRIFMSHYYMCYSHKKVEFILAETCKRLLGFESEIIFNA